MTEISKYPIDSFEHETFKTGYFTIPHGVLNIIKDGFISKSAGILLIVLLHVENRKNKTPNEWFKCNDREIYKTGFITRKTLLSGRERLKEHHLIDVVVGTKHRATKYRIAIPAGYYFKEWFRNEQQDLKNKAMV